MLFPQKLKIATNSLINRLKNQVFFSESQILAVGKLLSESVKNKQEISSLSDVEFKIFSQWGDDGIIQWLINNLEFKNKTFIEFGVENYRESNTRFLMMNNNWSGFIMDGSESNILQIIHSEYYWKYSLIAKAAFVDCDNVNDLLRASQLEKEVGILHIDIDGNDYWIWEKISVICPILVILEYNSVFGSDRAITIPYKSNFRLRQAHYSGLYFGASLPALNQLSIKKGYSFVGCNSAGNNAYFVRKDKLNSRVAEISVKNGYVESKFRDSRDENGRFTYLSGQDRLNLLKGMTVYNVLTNQFEEI